MAPLIQLRTAQQASFRHPAGVLGRVWRRQHGKSYVLGAEAIDVMLATPGITCVFMSAAVRLGQENTRKVGEVWREFVRALRAAGQHVTTTADDDAGQMIDPDAVQDMIESSKLEVKLWHDNATYSRSLVVAANPDTAVGYTGWLFLDEVGRMPNFQDVMEAALPFASSNPDYRIRLATTPPPDDSHYSYEILAPPPDTTFPVSPTGNYYTSNAGYLIHRVDAYDTYSDGYPLYDDATREPLSPDQSRDRAWDKTAWDRNFGCQFLRNTGQAAISATDLNHAQTRGSSEGLAVALFDQLPSDPAALETLVRSYLPPDWARKCTSGRIGLGLDLATSDKQQSNPSSLTVMELRGDLLTRLVIAFKSRDESITQQIIEIVLDDLARDGKRPRGLSIDASNEVFFAQSVRRRLAGRIRVHLIKSGESMTYRGTQSNAKVVLGNLYANAYADGRITLPAGKWLAEDHRLVRRVNGTFTASVLPDGRHADTFDSGKLAQWTLEGGSSGPTQADAVAITSATTVRPGLLNPYAHRHARPRHRLDV